MSDLNRRRWQGAVWLAALLALTLAVRVGVLVAMQENLRQDPDAYRNIADNLLLLRVYGMGQSSRTPRPTAYRPPLYPMLLAKFASDGTQVVLWRVAVIHVVLGLATVGLMWVVAGQMFQSGPLAPRVGIESGPLAPRVEEHSRSECTTLELAFRVTAGLLVASDPLLLNQSTLVMTETLAAFLTVLCLFALNRFTADRRPWNAGLAGCAIALAILCRPTYLPWLALVGITMLMLRHTNPKRERGSAIEAGGGSPSLALRVSFVSRIGNWLRRGVNVATLGLIAAIVVSPWAIRNYRVFGKPIVSTTHGGYTLYLANNHDFYDDLQTDYSGLPWDSAQFGRNWQNSRYQSVERMTIVASGGPKSRPSPSLLSLHSEILIDKAAYFEANRVIRDRPAVFAYSCLYRLRQLWSPLPHRLTADEPPMRTAMRYAVAAWYVAVYLLAAVGTWKLRSKLLAPPWLWGVLLCLVFTGIHTFYWTNLRMRAPLMPFVALVAAQGLSEIVRRVGQARSASAGPPESTSR
ncbi:MAG TPA: hypothetical protein VMP01_15195 [Pirellulaceae bacterium]|nr:hypothetical protein [Pirellulaceae bacterium]